MTKILTRIFTVALLTMVSISAWAQIDVQIANNGKFDGGTIKYIEQTKPDEKGFVTVTITVTPNKEKGYTISKKDITVVSTYPPSGPNANTRTPEIADNLTLYFKGSADADTDDLSAERDYTFIVPTGFGAWVKEATFQEKNRDGAKTGETDESDVYFLGVGSTYSLDSKDNNFYLCPTEDWINYKATDDFYAVGDANATATPFLTTYKCRNTTLHSTYDKGEAKWIFVKHQKDGKDYYYIKHASDDKYLTYNGKIKDANKNRIRVHLEATDSPDDLALFNLVKSSSTYYISPITENDESKTWYLNVSQGNMDFLTGQSDNKNDGPTGQKYIGGTIGKWSAQNNESQFYLEPVQPKKPEITYSAETEKVTITSATLGTTIYYTTDGSDPTSSDTRQTYSAPFDLTAAITVKAIAVKSEYEKPNSVVETMTITQQCGIPTITNNDGTIVIETNTVGATIYYTTDGSDPTTSGTRHTYSAPGFSLDEATTVKAVATKEGYANSEVATFTTGQYVYIQSNADKSWYLYPSDELKAEGQPYVKTQKSQTIDAVWQLFETSSGYRIKHFADGKYLVADASSLTNSVHLEAAKPEGNSAFFEITETSTSGVYQIKPKDAANDGNKNYLSKGDNGKNISLAASSDNKTQWLLVTFPIPPVISVDDISFTVSSYPVGTVYYTTDGSDPTESGTRTAYSSKVTLKYGPTYTVRAYTTHTVASKVFNSDEAESKTIKVDVISPTLSRAGDNINITSYQKGKVTYRYTFSTEGEPEDPVAPNGDGTGGTGTNGTSVALTADKRNIVKAIAYNIVDGVTYASTIAKFVVDMGSATEIENLNGIVSSTGNYIFKSGFSLSGTPIDENTSAVIGTAENPFKGTIDGNFVEITLGNNPLFAYVEDATIKNVIVSSASISTGAEAGAIANVAQGNTRIYNCGVKGGSITGSTDVGSIVGKLDGYSRVINCYSFATVSGGTNTGGIVGNNCYASNADNIRTMVMNCMFYGDISSDGNISPVFGGTLIDNLKGGGLNTYNYYRYQSDYSYRNRINKYNNSLAAKEEYLNRFEFYRQLLNSNKKLAALYATGSADNAEEKMAKWVLETADRSINDPMPYPILKEQAKYPSIINYDTNNLVAYDEDHRNEGRQTGTLSVTISAPTGWTNKPDGAKLLNASGDEIETSREITLIRTDKDYIHYNFNYDKVQLPYYNDYGTKNYTGNKVVTGWKITSVTIGSGSDVATQGSYKEGSDVGDDKKTPYNFADRKSYAKDLYTATTGDYSGRVFSQGAYWDVPYGATAITIEPYWGNAAYISDGAYDVVYDSGYGNAENVSGLGTQYTNKQTGYNNDDNQKVYTTISDALNSLSGSKVYDNALVLVGNRHMSSVPAGGTKPFTIMSVDMDHDNEPDYSLIYHHSGRVAISPIRFDFLNVMGTAQAQKPNGATKFLNVGIFKPKGWFELTNTSMVYFSQIEYDNGGTKAAEPLILLGGVVDQITSNHETSPSKTTTYIHVGGNVWFKQFNNGCHSDRSDFTKHIPISVTGGDYDAFYLSGIYKPDAAVDADNAECYISGGRFRELAGAGQQQINGDVQWQIYNADIENFYGGGINAAKPITGKITTNIYNSHITTFCGGPKFGNMQTDKKVETEANGCVFGTYYGAGYGGTSYNTVRTQDKSTVDFPSWESDYTTPRGKYSSGNKGIATDFDYEFFVWSSGETGGRFYVKYASLSTAQTNDVTSTLTNCIINGNVYGGGKLGRVAGKATTTLDGCTVNGDVFGAGYSGTLDPVKVRDNGFGGNPVKYPSVNTYSGMFEDGEFSGTTDYIWKNHTLTDGESNIATEDGKNYIYTNVDLDVLGQVDNVELVIKGSTTNITGSVYGGGEEANVIENTQVSITGGTITQNVFGGGKGEADEFSCSKAMVGVNNDGRCADPGSDDNKNKGTKVTISNGQVNGNVYGGGEVGRVEWNTQVTIGAGEGTPIINGSVFGAGAGVATHGYAALVRGNSTVTIQGNAKVRANVYGGGEQATVGRYWVKGINTTLCSDEAEEPAAPSTLPDEMPYKTRRGGKCTVIIQGSAQIGPDDAANISDEAGHVFGAGKGVTPNYNNTQGNVNRSKRMVDYNSEKHTGTPGTTWDYYEAYTEAQIADTNFKKYVWEYFATEDKYFEFLQTLALVTGTDVTIGGGTVKGNVYGGSQSGFVQDNTDVKVTGGSIGTEGTTMYGNVFGGGKGLEEFAEAGKVKGTTTVAINNGTVNGNVYGGGELGDVGIIDKTEKKDGQLTYNYYWKKTDGSTANTAGNNGITYDENETNKNTGICTVTISGGTIGTSGTVSTDHGNVFGAGKGSETTWWCEKAIAYATSVTVSGGTVNGTVYGGGQVGRVEDDAKVVIGVANATGDTAPTITGSVFGAGAGLYTHGYSALVRGNSDVTVQGTAQVGGSVYGGGEIASVGRFTVVGGLPKHPDSGGTCTVTIQDNAKIGTSGTTHNVYGACKGVDPSTITDRKSMQTYANRPKNANGTYKNEHDGWEFYEPNHDFVWVYYSEADYPAFLKTLALTSHPHVTVAEEATVYGSVFGGGQRGITLGRVDVDITGGTVEQDVYGGGALADTNCGNWDADSYTEVTGLVEGASVAGLYTRTGSGTTESPYVYTATTGENPTYDGSTTYYSKGKWHNLDQKTALYTTSVDLTGGLIKGDAYGGGLGQKTGFNSAASNIAAVVWGDISVNLGSSGGSSATAFEVNKYTDEGYVGIVKSGRVFGCNNLMGSPQGDVRVTVYKTVKGNIEKTTAEAKANNKALKEAHPDTYETEEGYVTPTYHVATVYGGGNLADYTAVGKKASVRIETCDVSIRDVYGGGNAAEVPETDVLVRGAYEIGEVFGGGNGKDPYKIGSTWTDNPGANIGNATHPGNATTLLTGGFVHEAYGGSNQLGTIFGSVAIDMGVGSTDDNTNGACTLDVEKLVGAGKNADVNGDLIMIMGCKPSSKTPLLYAGADNANVKGNVELTITSGNYGKVFGGNNEGGAIFGHIKLNIEETGGCDTPITIDELYLGGNMAAYSVYGYYEEGTMPGTTKPLYKPRTKADDEHQIVTFESLNPHTVPDVTTHQYDNPELNVISCTYIGKVFGGGYGTGAALYGDPIVNINMIPGSKADHVHSFMANDDRLTALSLPSTDNPNNLGIIGDVYGGGNAADIIGNTTVNIGMATTVRCHESIKSDGITYNMSEAQNVLGAYITGNVFGGGNLAEVSGDTHVNICGTQEPDSEKENGYKDTAVSHSGTTNFNISIGNSVYGGGNAADVKGNTFVTFADGYVFNGIYGGGYSGSVGTFTSCDKTVTIWNHNPSHEGTCIGKPTACKEGTGTCYVVVSGGQIGPLEVATQGMNRTTNGHGDPVPQGWVWGAGCGLVEDPSEEPDTHFKTYVNKTDVTIKGDAFILESIIGGGEFGRVLGNTLVKIEGGQIGVGYNKVTDGKPVAYTDAQWTEAEAAVRAGDASRINAIAAAMPACSTFPYGREVNGKMVYDTYDPFADAYKTAQNSDKYPGGSTDHASDGKTWIGCVFAGGSGYMPYVKRNNSNEITDYDWVQSAGWVEGDAEMRISGGHILSNVYGGNEYTDVKGTCKVTMTGGTVGVPRTVEQIMGNPLIGYIYGAGKGDPRVHFNKVTNVGDVEVEITGGTVFGSVYGGGEDGHVLRNVTMTIGSDGVGDAAPTGPFIGTWGTSYVDGNVFGGGRGFSGEAYTAGNVAGSVDLDIKGGTILGSVYGGGRMGSVGYGLFDATTNNQPTPGYGEMRDDTDTEAGFNTSGDFTNGRGHIDITISGGIIGNNYEYIMPNSTNMPGGLSVDNIGSWTPANWTAWKAHNNIHKTEFDTTTRQLKHTKGGNVFAGGMGNLFEQDGTTNINLVDWWKLGCVKSTKLTITGGTIKSNVYGGGELGQVVGCHTTDNVKLGTEISISGSNTLIGTEVKESSASEAVSYTFGSVFGGGYGSLEEKITINEGTDQETSSYPKYIAGRVMAGTKVNMTAGTVKASVYGGGEMAAVGESVVLGETLTEGLTGDTHVTISGGTIGKSGFGGAKMGNVYGGGSGHNNTVRSGQVFGNTNVTINGGTIYHNIYGGGAYGTVGDFAYITRDVNGVPKVFGVSGRSTDHSNSGVATVTITGGTIGVNGKENGMVFGSSRGDINQPEERDDHTAWVYDANVTIGDANGGPAIKGSIYGSGENGHTYNNAVVTINNGTIGIPSGEPITSNNGTPDDESDDITYEGAAYLYRGNVYGGGCGTDKYYADHAQETHDGNGQLFNPLAGIVYGNATVNINGGTVVRNIYGAGAMGSVGKLNTDGTVTGGTTTINISGGTIGVDGTKGDGNVFGAARGNVDAISNEAALVRKATDVSITGGTIKGNVYGGGELGCVGVYDISSDYRTFTWKNTDGAANSDNKNTGICNVIIDGSSAVINGHVFGAGKGKDDTFWCEKGIAYRTIVNVKNGTVNGNVYGGGEVGRVETDTEVKVGLAPEEGTSEPTINGSVFGGGAGVETHGYSALVRGNTTVTVDQNAHVAHSVYGGGEIASVGKYGLDDQNMPSILQGGGYCYVTVQGNAAIAEDVFGAGKGVTPHFDKDNSDETKRSRRMTLKSDWKDRVGADRFTWNYLPDEAAYSTYLETLALATHPVVTIDGSAAISGSVFGGGELGLTKGSVVVNIQGGTINEDVYGGGKLANSNTTSSVDLDGNGEIETVHPTTTLNLYGGLINGDAYGGGLGQKTGFYDANGAIATSDIEATVYGDITVNLGSIETPATEETPAVLGPATAFNIRYEDTGDKDEANQPIKVVQSGRVFGCNNLNGSPQGDVTVNVYKTVEGTLEGVRNTRTASDYYKLKEDDAGYVAPTYELAAVYGGGNLADYTATDKKASVIIHTCDVSVQHVYGGGNAAAVPETDVLVKGAYEIEHVFGGGNGKDMYKRANEWIPNPGANVLTNTNTLLIGGYIHEAYGGSNESGTISGNVTINTDSKDARCVCDLELVKLYGAGKNADIDGDLIVVLDCAPETKTEEIYGGAENANVRGNVELTITSGSFGKVFGGNNQSGAIFGHIILNIEETNCRPIIIDELYGCGNNAAYSVYGYKEGTDADGYKIYVPRTSLDDGVAVTFKKSDAENDIQKQHTTPQYADPQVNIISCTSIGKVFGGGYGSGATVYGNPTVNINQIYGKAYDGNAYTATATTLGEIGEVFGGGNEANVVGNTTVNVGTVSTVQLHQSYDKTTGYSMSGNQTVIGANITGNVYGGGNQAEVTGNTNVNIGRSVTPTP